MYLHVGGGSIFKVGGGGLWQVHIATDCKSGTQEKSGAEAPLPLLPPPPNSAEYDEQITKSRTNLRVYLHVAIAPAMHTEAPMSFTTEPFNPQQQQAPAAPRLSCSSSIVSWMEWYPFSRWMCRVWWSGSPISHPNKRWWSTLVKPHSQAQPAFPSDRIGCGF